MKIQFYYDAENFRLRTPGKIKKVIARIATDWGKNPDSIKYIFTTDENILNINREFLNHNYFTDIITFDYSSGESMEGEIYISVPTVRENAVIFDKSFTEEMYRVIFHGVLHLCGQNDTTEEEKKQMRSAEERYLLLLKENEF